MLTNYLNVLVGLLALAVGAFALAHEVLRWREDIAADRAVDALARPGRHARKATMWTTPTVPISLATLTRGT